MSCSDLAHSGELPTWLSSHEHSECLGMCNLHWSQPLAFSDNTMPPAPTPTYILGSMPPCSSLQVDGNISAAEAATRQRDSLVSLLSKFRSHSNSLMKFCSSLYSQDNLSLFFAPSFGTWGRREGQGVFFSSYQTFTLEKIEYFSCSSRKKYFKSEQHLAWTFP